MTSIRTLAAVATATAALSFPVFAQDMMMSEPMMMETDQVLVVTPSGNMRMTQMDESMMSMAMENAQAVEDGTMFFMSGENLMMMRDMQMDDGSMMSDMLMGQ